VNTFFFQRPFYFFAFFAFFAFLAFFAFFFPAAFFWGFDPPPRSLFFCFG
jgi:hypothetical protein